MIIENNESLDKKTTIYLIYSLLKVITTDGFTLKTTNDFIRMVNFLVRLCNRIRLVPKKHIFRHNLDILSQLKSRLLQFLLVILFLLNRTYRSNKNRKGQLFRNDKTGPEYNVYIDNKFMNW